MDDEVFLEFLVKKYELAVPLLRKMRKPVYTKTGQKLGMFERSEFEEPRITIYPGADLETIGHEFWHYLLDSLGVVTLKDYEAVNTLLEKMLDRLAAADLREWKQEQKKLMKYWEIQERIARVAESLQPLLS